MKLPPLISLTSLIYISATTAAVAEDGPKEHSRSQTKSVVEKLQSAQESTAHLSPSGFEWGNPFVSFLPTGAEPDPDHWRAVMVEQAAARAAAVTERSSEDLVTGDVSESEPNDVRKDADPVPSFGTGEGEVRSINVSGVFTAPAAPTALPTFAEDDGSITLASSTGLVDNSAVVIEATIGDGPFGTTSGDFDFYLISGVTQGQQIIVDIDTDNPTGDLDTDIAIYDSQGNILALNQDEDGSSNFDSFLAVPAPADGDYYVSVAGSLFPFLALLKDPFDSASGRGVGSLGDYRVTIRLDQGDRDWFAFELEACDILGVNLVAAGSHLTLKDAAGDLLIASSQDLSGAYPPSSPLPGGGRSVLHHVAEQAGTYNLRALGIEGRAYSLELRVFRQPQETIPEPKVLFVDFDGATVDTSIFIGAPQGTAVLSPLSDFLSNWGLLPTDQDAVIDAILASLSENMSGDPGGQGPNRSFGIEIRNSRDHEDPFGQPNVSRLIVGGSIPELGFATIGIAQSLDPGNFELAETGIILLDLLSAPAGNADSLNSFPRADGVSMVDFVGIAIGNIAAHEAGHYTGNFHTEQMNDTAELMDRGGNLPNTLGLGPDGIFGSADDVDVDFGADQFVDAERFAGVENTLTVVSCGCAIESLFVNGFETGDTTGWSGTTP